LKYIGITGSRAFQNEKLLFEHLDILRKQYEFITLVSGGARGADTIAELYAKRNNLNIIVYLPDYEKYGKTAPFVRNTDIANKADILVACFRTDLPCHGTRDTITKAGSKPIIILSSEY